MYGILHCSQLATLINTLLAINDVNLQLSPGMIKLQLPADYKVSVNEILIWLASWSVMQH